MLGFILGRMMEENLRCTLLLSKGDPPVFFTRPLSAVLLLIAAAMVMVVLMPAISKKRDDVFNAYL